MKKRVRGRGEKPSLLVLCLSTVVIVTQKKGRGFQSNGARRKSETTRVHRGRAGGGILLRSVERG